MQTFDIIKNLNNKPCSSDVLEYYYNNVLKKSFLSLNVSIISYKESGKPFELKYLIKNLISLNQVPKNHVFAWLDVHDVLDNEGLAFSRCIEFVANNYGFTKEVCDKYLNTNQLSYTDFLRFNNQLKNLDLKITYVLQKYDSYMLNKAKITSLLHALHEQDFNTVSFIYLVSDESTELPLHALSNVVSGKDLFFDAECIDCALQNYQSTYNLKLSPNNIKSLQALCVGEPALLRKIIMETVSNPEYLNNLVKSSTIEEVYTLLDSVWLQEHFKLVLNGFLPTTVDLIIKSKLDSLNDFCLTTGLFNKNADNKISCTSFVFNKFLQQHADVLLNSINSGVVSPKNIEVPVSSNLKDSLTGQELLVYELLLKNKGQLVSKDQISQEIWGEHWEDKYSDWALDKLISLLRKKLEQSNFEGSLKSVKGRGVILT